MNMSMNSKQKLKVKHKVEELIMLIEKNNLEAVIKMVENCKDILKKKKMDDNEPIFYAIKYRCNKIFNFILENSRDIKYDMQKFFTCVIECGSGKIFRSFIQFYKIDLNTVNRQYILYLLKRKVCEMVQVLVNDFNFCYSYLISQNAYNVLGYNFAFNKGENNLMEVDGENISQKNGIRVAINKTDGREEFSFTQIFNEIKDSRFGIIFHRYKKLFLVRVKSLKPPKYLRSKDYQEIIKYL